MRNVLHIPRRGAALLAAAIAVSVVATAPSAATFPGENGAIVFQQLNRGDFVGLGSVDPDGSELQRLPLGRGNGFPWFAPDGKSFVFSCRQALCTARPDGTDVEKLTAKATRGARWPGFSANNKRLVFIAANGALTVARRDGSHSTELERAGAAWQPSFFPSGERIVFSRRDGKQREIYSINSDGSGLRQISRTAGKFQDINPSVSPDGRWIAFERNNDDSGGNALSLWVVRSNGGGQKMLINQAGTPAYSPDGRLIAHQQFEDGDSSIAISKANGSDTRIVTPLDREFENRPTWQPLP